MSTKPTSLRTTVTVIIFVLLVAAFCYLLSPILLPFIAGTLLAYLFDPLVNRLMRWRMSRLSAVIVVFLLIIAIIVALVLVFIPIIQDQIDALAQTLPEQFATLQKRTLPWLMSHLGIQESASTTIKKIVTDNLSKVGNISTWTFQTLLISGKHVITAIINCILIPVVTFYLLRDWDVVIDKVHGLIPRRIEPTVVKLTKACDTVLSAFFRGQLLVMLALSVFYAIALSAIGLQAGVIIGLIVGIASLVPYLGSIVGLVVGLIAAIIQFGTLSSILLVLAIFAVGHLLENLYLAPKLIGDRVGLHPVAVIFAILAGAELFGFFGVLLALPVASVIMVLLRHLHHYYYHANYNNSNVHPAKHK